MELLAGGRRIAVASYHLVPYSLKRSVLLFMSTQSGTVSNWLSTFEPYCDREKQNNLNTLQIRSKYLEYGRIWLLIRTSITTPIFKI